MTAVWVTIAGLVVTTAAIKAAGPVLIGGRQLPSGANAVIGLLAPALLTALILTDTFATGQDLTVDSRAAGVGLRCDRPGPAGPPAGGRAGGGGGRGRGARDHVSVVQP